MKTMLLVRVITSGACAAILPFSAFAEAYTPPDPALEPQTFNTGGSIPEEENRASATGSREKSSQARKQSSRIHKRSSKVRKKSARVRQKSARKHRLSSRDRKTSVHPGKKSRNRSSTRSRPAERYPGGGGWFIGGGDGPAPYEIQPGHSGIYFER